jgi:hypothetical protein
MLLLMGNGEIKMLVRGVVPQMSEAMDHRTMNGVLPETRMRRIIAGNSPVAEVRDDIRTLRELAQRMGAGIQRSGGRTSAPSTVLYNNTLTIRCFFQKAPPDWVFPQGPILNVYQYWRHGDTVKKISPLKKLRRVVLSWCRGENKGYSKNLEEVKFLLNMLDEEAK